MDVRPIEYAPPLPMHQRRHVRRRVIAITAILIGIPLVWYAAPRAWRHAELLYWQDKAMNYSPPADQVVFDNDPYRVRELLKSREFRLAPTGVNVRTAIRVAVPCERFFELASSNRMNSPATLFLHARTNSKGERRLIFLQIGGPDMRGLGYSQLYIDTPLIFRPGTPFTDPMETPELWTRNIAVTGYNSVRYFAGQVESDDPSHFSIAYETDGKRSVIDGWLMDDDTVKLEKRR
jgi:hypothetical protein